MKKSILAVSAAIGALSVPGAFADDDEIIVTGSRISNYESDTIPVIHLERQADFMVLEVAVESDSRDAKLRQDEVFKTLGTLADRAECDQRIELGVVRTFETDGDEIQYIEPFSRNSIGKDALQSGGRADTSRATVVAKTPISPTDTYDTAYGGLEAFVDGATLTGRATVTEQNDPGPSIVDIGQYRELLLRMLASDNDAVRSIFGDDYRVWIAGLEKPVRWRVTGPLELAIYFPYVSSISPN